MIVTNKPGCSAGSDAVNFPGCSADDIVIFPNPTEEIFNINWCKKVTVRLMCMDGKQVKIVYDTDQVSLDDLPNADYMVAFYDEAGKKLKVRRITKLAK